MTVEKRIFYSICIISFAGSFLSTALNIAIPIMSDEFRLPPDKLSWVITAFLIPTAACLLPMGKVSDIYGRRKTYATALVTFAITTAATVLTTTLPLLLITRVLQGIALSAVYVSYMPLLLATTDDEHQGHILGLCVGLTYLGLSLGPVIGGILTEYMGWRSIFILTAIMTIAAYIFIHPIHEEWYANGAPFVNAISSVLSIAGIALFLWGLSSYTTSAIPLWAGLLLICLFILHESRSYHPLLPLYIFRSYAFSLSTLAAFIQYSATYALSFLLSLYLQILAGLSPAVSGLILLVQPIMMAVLSPKAGSLADKYSPMYIATAGLALTTVGLAGFACWPDASIAAVILFLLLIGTGSALFGAPNNSAIMNAVKPSYHGIASSMLALARNLGQASSMAAVTLILSWYTAATPLYSQAVRSSLRVSYALFAALCLLSVFTSLARQKKQ